MYFPSYYRRPTPSTSTRTRFDYYSPPDGQEVYRKFIYAMRHSALAVTCLSMGDVLINSHPKGYVPTLKRIGFVSAPILAGTATFVVLSNMIGGFRRKDDRWNWFFAGFAAGTLFTIWKRTFVVGFHCGAFFGACAFFTKYAHEQGWVLFPTDGPIQHMVIWDPDWTYTKERKGNWVRSKDEIEEDCPEEIEDKKDKEKKC